MSQRNDDLTRMHGMDEPYVQRGGIAKSDILIFMLCGLIILCGLCGLIAALVR